MKILLNFLRMLDHPSQFLKIHKLIQFSEENLKTFNFVPVGSGQVEIVFEST